MVRSLLNVALRRPVELGLLGVLLLAAPGLVLIGLSPPAPNLFVHPWTRVRVSASSAFTRDNFDTAYLLDGLTADQRLAWASQRDPAPWVQLDFPEPKRLERVYLRGAEPRGELRPPEHATVVCAGAEDTIELRPTAVARELSGELGGRSCAGVRVNFTDAWAGRTSVAVLELAYDELEP